MKRLKNYILTIILIISATTFSVFNASAATSPIIYGKIRQSDSEGRGFTVGICAKTYTTLPIGAIMFTLEYDTSSVKFVSAQLNDAENTAKLEIDYDENGCVKILYGSADGESLELENSFEFITIEFKKLDKNAPINVNLCCEHCINTESEEIELLYVDNISTETEKIVEDSSNTSDILKITGSVNKDNSKGNTSSVKENSSGNSSDESSSSSEVGNTSTVIIEAESNTLSSMFIGGLIVAGIAALVFFGYRAGLKSAVAAGNCEKTDKDKQ